ncbi:hypothetical protein M441DRAFT_395284 [Trichoderma asperellum CBS 433.97]|uniref:Uncharacterized protein n=1 Tax=Trichoderma asperellum (strain ATCC 204424 / CBS 433.97 / NBRC 101777) TaxID=1042311 RepID=A0A2T3Z8V9_TRIA4|nr:hypothetical protein M441DRAFT_395284 [Trichoderma asperellum CBS 433.97]PTB41244.1 hypothetical protein M441DRAFT_395284 [Trichoderma asperellum CBS 433.97]
MTASGPSQSRLISHVGNSEKASKQERYVSLVLVFHVWRPCGSRRVSIESACDGLASPRRLQQTSEISGPGGPACILREDAAVSFSVSYGKSLRSLLRKLECDMQRLFCFGRINHTIPIILLRAMLHLFFSPGKMLICMPISLLRKNTTNYSNLLLRFLDVQIE